MARDLMAVHPELRQTAEKLPRLPFNRWTIRLIQGVMRLLLKPKFPTTIQADTVHIPSPDQKHTIRLCIYKPKDLVTPAPVLVWLHGGGLIIGRADMTVSYVSDLIQELGLVIVSVDYRLAPQHPFPHPLDDCYTALQWVHDHAQSLGIDPKRIVIGGESAGGGLAASLAQMAHDRGEIKPIFQLLIYPMLDDKSALRTDLPQSGWLVWTPQDNRFGWESYLRQACGSDNLPRFAVPSRQTDLSGLPPAWIGVGTLDLFYDEDVAYAEKLKRDGVDCELVTIPGAFHGFDQFNYHLPVIQAFRKSQIATLKKYLAQ